MADQPDLTDHRAEARLLLNRARDHYYQGRNAANLIAAAHVHVLLANGALGERLITNSLTVEATEQTPTTPAKPDHQERREPTAGVTHLSPAPGFTITPCCGRTPFELSADDRMTVDSAAVDCPGQEAH